MKARTLALAAVSALLVTLAAQTPAPASCPRDVRPLGEWYEMADAIFVGRVLEVADVPVSPPPGASPDAAHAEYTTRFHVEEQFKGDVGERVTVLAANTWRNCIVEFDIGEQYVVFAFRRGADHGTGRVRRGTEDAALRSHDSSPTGRVTARADALAYLRRRAATGKEPSLVGAIYDRTPASIQDTYGRSPSGLYGATTRSGVPVILTSGDRKLTAVSDGDGAFAFDDVPEGTYSIRIELPAGHRLLERHERAPFVVLRPDKGQLDRVEIKAGETAARYFTVTGSASVSGRAVTPTGEPMRWAYAHLVLASALSSFRPDTGHDNLRAFFGERGEFQFEVVPPGEYVLVLNPGREDAFDWRGPTFYYPGVTDRAKATRFRISEGKKLELGVLKAPPVTTYRPVDVAVVETSGGVRQVDLRCVPIEPAGEKLDFTTDEAGRARLYLRPGVRFRIGAVSPSDHWRLEDSVEVGAEGPLSPVKLVVAEAVEQSTN